MATSSGARYTKELHSRFGYSAAWLPNTKVQLGDVCTLRRGVYERVSDLGGFDIAFEETPSESLGLLEHSSSGEVSLRYRAAGNIPIADASLGQTEAEILIEMKKSGSIFFQATGCQVVSIADIDLLGLQIVDLYRQGLWPRDYFVTTQVVEAERTTVLIAEGGSAVAELSLSSNAGAPGMASISIKTGVELTRSKNIGTKVIAEGRLQPLFLTHAVKPRFFGKDSFPQRSDWPSNIGSTDEIDFQAADYPPSRSES